MQNGRLEQNREAYYDYAYKVILIGDSGVGKTCVLIRFKEGAFLKGSFISTVGIDFRNKIIEVDGVKVKLQIWDTAGQERFRSVTTAYYRDAHALLLLYDVSSRGSFQNTKSWLSEIRYNAPTDSVIILLGNKADVSSKERVVRREEGERLAKDFGVTFLETSAKTGMNVDLAFQAAARELMAKEHKGKLKETNFDLKTYVSEKEEKPSCCS